MTIRFSEQKLANFRKHVLFKTAQFVVLKLKKKKKKSPGPSSHFGLSLLTRSPFLILNVYFKRTFSKHSGCIVFFFFLPVVLRLLLFLPSFLHYASVLSSPSVFSGFCLCFLVALPITPSLVFSPHSSILSAHLFCP